MHETDSVDVQVKILTGNLLLALNSCAPFETKLIKTQPARWKTEAIISQPVAEVLEYLHVQFSPISC